MLEHEGATLLREMGEPTVVRSTFDSEECVMELFPADGIGYCRRSVYLAVVAYLAAEQGTLSAQQLAAALNQTLTINQRPHLLPQVRLAVRILEPVLSGDEHSFVVCDDVIGRADDLWNAFRWYESEPNQEHQQPWDKWPTWEELQAMKNPNKFHQNLIRNRQTLESLPKGLSKREVADALDISEASAVNVCQWAGYVLKRKSRAKADKLLRDLKPQVEAIPLVGESPLKDVPPGLTRQQLADHLKISYQTASELGRKAGYVFVRQPRPEARFPARAWSWEQVNWARTDREIAEALGVSRQTAYNNRQKYASGSHSTTSPDAPVLSEPQPEVPPPSAPHTDTDTPHE